MAKKSVKERFRAALKENCWLGVKPVLLGVSGGSDSMSLLHLFLGVYPPFDIVVAHLDHGVRATSSRDSEFVAETCASLGVLCVTEHKNMYSMALAGESPEAAGRRLRYDLYERTAARYGCAVTALGHTRTDLAESVILNIARGSGLWGLAGIPPSRGMYIRPLLSFDREELRDFLRENGHAWVEDETNDEDIYTRNRVRHHIIPLLESCVNERASVHLAELAQEAWQWRQEQDRMCYDILTMCAVPFNEWPSVSLSRLRKLAHTERVSLFRFIGRRLHLGSMSRARLDELSRLTASSGRWTFQWGSEVDVFADDGALTFAVASEKRAGSMELSLGGTVRWGGWKASLVRGSAPEGVQDFGFVLPCDDAGSLILRNNGNSGLKRDAIYPIIEQEDKFCAKRINGKWDFGNYSVKYTGALRVVLIPLAGAWREITWN